MHQINLQYHYCTLDGIKTPTDFSQIFLVVEGAVPCCELSLLLITSFENYTPG